MVDKHKNIVLGISITGKAFIVLAVFLALKARNSYDKYLTVNVPNFNQSSLEIDDNEQSLGTVQKVSFIKARQLFGSTTVEAPAKVEAPKKKSELKLRLVGTTLIPGKSPVAILEDSSNKKQDAFSPGESVFEKGTLKDVLVDKITIDRDGQLETIEVAEGENTPGDPNESNIRSDGGNFVVPEDEVNSALSNLPVLLSQARAVPYFRNGQSIGMRLYAIRGGSLYEKLGLKNSDIIKNINNSPVNDPAKALKLFEDLKSQRSIAVNVEREGQDLQLNYQIR